MAVLERVIGTKAAFAETAHTPPFPSAIMDFRS